MIALIVSCIAVVVSFGVLAANVRRYHQQTGKWLPW